MESEANSRRTLGPNLTAALVVKLALLVALYLLFFRGDDRPAMDGTRAAQHLLSSEVAR
jgi:hypothetical protein